MYNINLTNPNMTNQNLNPVQNIPEAPYNQNGLFSNKGTYPVQPGYPPQPIRQLPIQQQAVLNK